MTAPGGLTVVQEPPQLLVQDLGRYGWAHLGVPPSGALDPAALALANRLVGNLEGAAGLEILRGGCAFDAKGSVRIALTGPGRPAHRCRGRLGWAASLAGRCRRHRGPSRAGEPVHRHAVRAGP
jgi:hypothetical protein